MPPSLRPGTTVAHLIETDGPGGAERVLTYLVARLAAEGLHNLVVLPEEGEGWLAGQLPRERVETVHVPLRGVSIRQSLRAVTSTIRESRPAVVHSHEFTMSVLAGVASWRLRLPHVMTLHGSRYYADRLDRRIATAFAARVASTVVAVSRSLADHIAADLWLSRDSVHVIHNGVPPIPVVAPTLRSELGLDPSAKLIATVGNLYPVKGHRYLLTAAASLMETTGRNLHVAIAGRGPEEPTLTELALQLGFRERLHLLGLRDDVPNILRSADVFVLPSLSEALPLALLEAMQAGTPVIATRVGEIPAVLEGGQAGLLVPPADSTALASALTAVITDTGRAFARAEYAKGVASGDFSIERMVESYLSLYHAVSTDPWSGSAAHS